MIKFTVFFEVNMDFLDVRCLHITTQLSGSRPGNYFKRMGFEKRLRRLKISCVTHGFPVPIMFQQGIEPQGYWRLPYQAGFSDGFFGVGYKKGKGGHILSENRGQMTENRRQKIRIYPFYSVHCFLYPAFCHLSSDFCLLSSDSLSSSISFSISAGTSYPSSRARSQCSMAALASPFSR